MQTTINGLHDLKPDEGILCDDCDYELATRIGLTYRGTYNEPAEYIQLCEKCAGDDPNF